MKTWTLLPDEIHDPEHDPDRVGRLQREFLRDRFPGIYKWWEEMDEDHRLNDEVPKIIP